LCVFFEFLSLHKHSQFVAFFQQDFIIKDDEELQNTVEQRSYILSEVFCHVVNAIWWMDESDSEPCNVVLLDIVCSLEVIEIEDTLKQALIDSIEDNVCLNSTLQVYQRSNSHVRHIPPKMSDKFESQHSLSPTIWSDILVGREWDIKRFFFTFLEVNMSNIL
jgi:hypothetical protein